MPDLWLPIILALIAAIPGLIGLWRQLRKDTIDAATQYSALLNSELEKRRKAEQVCDDLQDQIDVLERECARNAKYIRRLSAYIELTGGEVPPIEDTKPRR
jgi:hypothetical protein